MNSIKTSAKGWWLRGSDKVLLVSAVLDYEICLFYESLRAYSHVLSHPQGWVLFVSLPLAKTVCIIIMLTCPSRCQVSVEGWPFLWFYFSLPTDVQAEAIPMILGGGDVLMVCILHWLWGVFYPILMLMPSHSWRSLGLVFQISGKVLVTVYAILYFMSKVYWGK